MSDIAPSMTRASGAIDPSVALLDCVEDAIVVLGPELEVRYANRAATMLAARRDGSVPAEFGSHLLHPDDLPLALEAVDRAIHEQFSRCPHPPAAPDG